MRQRSRPRVLAVASGGGHWVQLRRLRSAFDGFDTVWVTVDPDYAHDLEGAAFHTVRDATRWNPLGLVAMALQMLWLLLRLRPDVVVTTGAAPGFFAVVIGKLLGSRTAWIDSIANADEFSGSGARVGRFADLWLTQWPHLAREEGPGYEGAVL
ncbi:MAG: UDP-N-acetylglucosamine--LPS N-acetylglucosamine transferase [Deltaproteobacteria bacterium]|nr:UDP-N-acetylglucosamine--LPS N-acetylglucosamine transferase [Deltaproteobacteria bacterium]